MIPLIGWVKNAQLRVALGMTSNVMLLEGASDAVCRLRCEDLSRHRDRGLLVRTLVTIPALLYMIIIVLCVMGEQLVAGGCLLVFWIVFALWIVLPASAAANTFAYLEVASEQRSGVSEIRGQVLQSNIAELDRGRNCVVAPASSESLQVDLLSETG